MHEAPLLTDARAAFLRARRGTTLEIQQGVAVCELRYRSGVRRGGTAERIVDATAALVTLGVTELMRNAGEPDVAGIDLVLGARFGHGDLYRARGAYGAFRTWVTFPVQALRAGEAIWMRLRDADVGSGDEILGEWNVRFDGRSPIVLRHGRSSVECRLLPRAVVERRVGVAVRRAERDIDRMTRAVPSASARIARARRPLELAVPVFDGAANRADEQLALARANTADARAWPELAAAERAFDAALAPIAAARTERLARGFDEEAPAPLASTVPICDSGLRIVLVALRLPANDHQEPGARPPRPPRIVRALALDDRGLLRTVRFRAARVRRGAGSRSALDADEPFATARIEGFDASGRHPCAAPAALLLSSGRRQWVATAP